MLVYKHMRAWIHAYVYTRVRAYVYTLYVYDARTCIYVYVYMSAIVYFLPTE